MARPEAHPVVVYAAVIAFMVLTITLFGLIFELLRVGGWPRALGVVVAVSYITLWFYVQAYGVKPFG